ncbi:MAG TPA: preprotein translocase subunit SecG [Myxococcota bacterium]
MGAVITTLHVVACIFLVAVVLLQRGRGAQVGAVFGGGGGGTMFGARGAGNFLTKLTTGAAIVFMLTSLSLSYLGLSGSGDRLFDADVAEEQAAEEPLFEPIEVPPAAAGTAESDAPEAP